MANLASLAVPIGRTLTITDYRSGIERVAQTSLTEMVRSSLLTVIADRKHGDDLRARPAALQLRAMNIIYETTKARGATILTPSAMVDAMNPGGVLGLTAFSQSAPRPA